MNKYLISLDLYLYEANSKITKKSCYVRTNKQLYLMGIASILDLQF